MLPIERENNSNLTTLVESRQNSLVKEDDVDMSSTTKDDVNIVNDLAMRAPTEKNVSILCGFLPAISNFVSTSTLLESNLAWLGVTLGFFVGVINAYALYRNKKKPTCWARGVLVFLEVVGIICISYNAIQSLHKTVPASLPQPFDRYSIQAKMWIGISLFSAALFFSLVLIHLENRNEDSKKNVIYAKRIITGGIVFVGTYPLMINFFTGLNHEVCTIWLIAIAVGISLCSCIGQAFLISRHERNNQTKEEKRNFLVLEWFGEFFMSVEIVLSFANTAFSTNDSSVDQCLQLLQSDWVNKNSQTIGVILFVLSIVTFMIATCQHFKPLYHDCGQNVSKHDSEKIPKTDLN